MMHKYSKVRIDPNAVIKIYKMIKRNPNKIWVRSDFSHNFPKKRWILERHIKLLIQLNIIKVVSAIYYTGRNYRARRDIKGYKLIT